MNEDIGTIFRKGFSTWTKNLVICVPFILEALVTVLLSLLTAFVFVLLFIMPFVSRNNIDPGQLSPEDLLMIVESLISNDLLFLMVFGIVFLLVYMLIQSFFAAGAIGMSKEASERGDTGVRDLSSYGARSFAKLFLLKVLISLLLLAGIIFLIPGFLSMGELSTLLSDPEKALASTSLMVFGLFLWGFYIIVLSLILVFAEYALVIDNLDPLSAIENGLAFFMSNKFSALMLWSLLICISVAMSILGEIFSYNELIAQLWAFVNFALTALVIQPLLTIWWTRLYLSRNGKKLYSFEDYILDH